MAEPMDSKVTVEYLCQECTYRALYNLAGRFNLWLEEQEYEKARQELAANRWDSTEG